MERLNKREAENNEKNTYHEKRLKILDEDIRLYEEEKNIITEKRKHIEMKLLLLNRREEYIKRKIPLIESIKILSEKDYQLIIDNKNAIIEEIKNLKK